MSSKKTEATTDVNLTKQLNALISIIQQRYPPFPLLAIRSLAQGLFTALGATIGLSLFLAIVTLILKNFIGIPAVDWLFDQIKTR